MQVTLEDAKTILKVNLKIAQRQYEEASDREKSYFFGRVKALDEALNEIRRKEVNRW